VSEIRLKRLSLRDELAFLLDSTVDLPHYEEGKQLGYDRGTLLLRLECAVTFREREAYLAGWADARERAVGLVSENGWHYHRECSCGHADAAYLHCMHDRIPSHCVGCGQPLPSGVAGECECEFMCGAQELETELRALEPEGA